MLPLHFMLAESGVLTRVKPGAHGGAECGEHICMVHGAHAPLPTLAALHTPDALALVLGTVRRALRLPTTWTTQRPSRSSSKPYPLLLPIFAGLIFAGDSLGL